MPDVVCLCGHPKLSHEVEDAPACVRDMCGCSHYRPRTGGQTAAPTGPPPGLSQGPAAPLVAAGKASENKRIVALAERIETQLEQLSDLLHGEVARKRAVVEVRRLEAELKAARERLHPSKQHGAQRQVAQSHACTHDECDRSFESTQALAMHRRRAHEGFDPHAKAV